MLPVKLVKLTGSLHRLFFDTGICCCMIHRSVASTSSATLRGAVVFMYVRRFSNYAQLVQKKLSKFFFKPTPSLSIIKYITMVVSATATTALITFGAVVASFISSSFEFAVGYFNQLYPANAGRISRHIIYFHGVPHFL
jgi:hypothetical protein